MTQIDQNIKLIRVFYATSKFMVHSDISSEPLTASPNAGVTSAYSKFASDMSIVRLNFLRDTKYSFREAFFFYMMASYVGAENTLDEKFISDERLLFCLPGVFLYWGIDLSLYLKVMS